MTAAAMSPNKTWIVINIPFVILCGIADHSLGTSKH